MPNQPPCAIFPIPIAIPRITLTTKTSTFDYYGPVQPCLTYKASKFLTSITDAGELELITAINSFLLATQSDSISDAKEKKACWFTIRVTKPTSEFEVPRWHQDGRMFLCDEGHEDIVRSKYALTLLGPTTLMLQPEEQVFAIFKKMKEQHYLWLKTEYIHKPTENERNEADGVLRTRLAETFKDMARICVGDGEIVRFSWGQDDSPVHSEPDLVSDRVFVTVLYGSERELRCMCELRDTEYGAMNR